MKIWTPNGEKTPLSFDWETALIRPGCLAPKAVCLTWKRPGLDARIALWTDVKPRLKGWLEDPTVVLVGANVAYDMGVICANYPDLLPLVFQAYDEDRVTDIQIRQKLLDIANGCYRGRMVQYGDEWKYEAIEYSLFDVTRRSSGRILKKDGFRLFYQFFRNTPLERWVEHACFLQTPEGAASIKDIITAEQVKELPGFLAANPSEVVSYPLEDAIATEECVLVQEKGAKFLADQFRQTRYAWWQHLMSAWGIHTDPTAVRELRIKTEALYQECHKRLVETGLVRVDGSKDTKAAKAHMEAICKERGQPVILTPAGRVCLDSDACEATEDPILEDYAEYSTLSKVMSNDLEMLQKGVHVPIQSRFDLAETGRSTSSNPNIMNLRRMPGIRECFRPRAGKVFVQADYDQLELRTLAQVCWTLLGQSTLREVLNSGGDPHTKVAAEILGISYEEALKNKKRKDVDDARQTGKVANFGFPGGLGPARLCHFAKKSYNVVLTEARAKELKDIWLRAFPEMRAYFQMVEALPSHVVAGKELRWMKQLFSERIRGGASYTAACNSFFQGLGADVAKSAGWLLSKGCYATPSSPLFGARIVMFVHDEFVLECDEGREHEVGQELVRCMTTAIQEAWLPDVRPTTEAVAMRYYSKEAYPRHDTSNRLIPWNGQHKCSACKHEYIGPGSDKVCPACGHQEPKS